MTVPTIGVAGARPIPLAGGPGHDQIFEITAGRLSENGSSSLFRTPRRVTEMVE